MCCQELSQQHCVEVLRSGLRCVWADRYEIYSPSQWKTNIEAGSKQLYRIFLCWDRPRSVTYTPHFSTHISLCVCIFVYVCLGSEGLGFTVVTRDSSVHGPGPILVKNILPRGAAVKDGRLQSGDRILEVQAIQAFKNSHLCLAF